MTSLFASFKTENCSVLRELASAPLKFQASIHACGFHFWAVSWQIQVDLASSALYTFLNTTLTETDNYKKIKIIGD
jgi:hypothetical protein